MAQHCRIVHAEGYIDEVSYVENKAKVTKRTPAVRILIKVGEGGIIPCTDALPKIESVDDWAEYFSLEVEHVIAKHDGKVDRPALRNEFAKIARDAIKRLDESELALINPASPHLLVPNSALH